MQAPSSLGIGMSFGKGKEWGCVSSARVSQVVVAIGYWGAYELTYGKEWDSGDVEGPPSCRWASLSLVR